MYRHVIVHYHEIGLKGKNRGAFEDQLVRNIRAQLPSKSIMQTSRLSGRILVTLADPFGGAVHDGFGRVFGIASFAPVLIAEPDLQAIGEAAIEIRRRYPTGSFAVRTKRADKTFPLTSDAVSREVGARVLAAHGGTVDLTNPDVEVSIEILLEQVFVTAEWHPGPGGLPVGSSGKVVAMLSGGIDSPVAAWKVMKRGCETVFAHFHSYPHTSRASISKVRELARIVGAYQPKSVVYFIPLAEAQRQVVMHTEPKYRVLLYRRLMVRVANALARSENAGAIITGESIGQVASQTIPNLHATEIVATVPVFRPLIGDDKEEIIAQAKRIGTYEVSIQPHDDCCTLFIPKNPATRARISDLEREEAKLNTADLVASTIAQAARETI